MSNVNVKYGAIAPNAKEKFVPFSDDVSEVGDIQQLRAGRIEFEEYGNPCDLYSVSLDDIQKVILDNSKQLNVGYWSDSVSDESGIFKNPILLTLTATQLFTSDAITLMFDTVNEIYPVHLNIKWYRDDEILSNKDFKPDSALFSCINKVDFYNKIEITFYKLNMPNNRLKIKKIDYGFEIEFNGDELKNISIIQTIDPLSSKLEINTANIIIDNKHDVQFSFQAKQPLTINFNEDLTATVFVKKAKQKSRNVWDVSCEDYIGIMQDVPFYGDIYKDKLASDLIDEIFNVCNVPYSIDEQFTNEKITGYIPYTNCREALMQVSFAIGAVVDTSYSNVVKIIKLNDEVIQTIPLNRIMQGQSFEEETIVTDVEVVAHSYRKISDELIVYNAEENSKGQDIFVVFSEPLHDLTITNGAIKESSTNYAIIDAFENCTLSGKKYEHSRMTKNKRNVLVSASDAKNSVSIRNATLINRINVDKILDRCYNYLTNTNVIKSQIIEGKRYNLGHIIKYGQHKYGVFKYGQKTNGIVKYGEKKYGTIKYRELKGRVVEYDKKTMVGEKIQIETEYKGSLKATVIRQKYNLNGGIIIKDTVMR